MKSNSSSCIAIDNSFGPYAGHCRGGFDFTLVFEETVFSTTPISLVLIVMISRLVHLFKQKVKVKPGILLYPKIIGYAVLVSLQVALLVLWARPGEIRTKSTLPSLTINLAGTLLLILLSYYEHVRSVRPSFILAAYLSFSALLDATRTRTLWLQNYNSTIAAIFSVATATKLIVFILEVINKRSSLNPEYQHYPTEATSGIFNRSFFWWLNPLFRHGYFTNLAVDDLFTLDKQLISQTVYDSLNTAWQLVPKETTKSLLSITLGNLKWPLLSGFFPRLCLTAFNFCQPFLINAAISISQKPVTNETTNAGYGLIGAYVIVYTGIAVTTGRFQHLTYRAITMMRGGLISLLYSKSADLNVSGLDPSSSVVLMSADIERITVGWQTIHELWANILEVALAIYLLKRQLGVACVIPVAVAIVSMMGSIMASGLIMARQAAWLQAIEKRVTATTAMLGAMKGIKMCGLTDILSKSLQDLRVNELEISKGFRKIIVWNMAFSFSTPVISPILTFTVFSMLAKHRGNGETLDTTRVFTSLSLFTLLAEPLGSLIMSLANFMGGVGSFHRIQEFLESEVRVDDRNHPPSAEVIDSKHLALQLQSLPSNSSSTLTEKTSTPPRLTHISTSYAAIIQDGSFGWDKEKEPVLHSINLNVPREKFTMLIGPVGCGKSTLIKAVLGETFCMGGSVQVPSSEIAFCDQTAWHMNVSVQQSIIGVLPMEKLWYKSVVHACALEEDFKQLPRGDQTVIGSSGIALSGGQSQRIALARAVYARKDFMILDDVLRGLDGDTENRVFHNLLGMNGLLRRHHTTVLIASSAATRLPYTDHIIVLDKSGKITEQGTFEDLQASGGYVSSFSLSPPDWSFIFIDSIASSDDGKSNNEKEMRVVVSEVTDLIEEEKEDDPSRRMGDTSVYLYYINAVGWWPTFFFIIFISGFVVCFSFPAIWVKWWSEANSKAPNQKIPYYLGIYGLIGALALICLMVSAYQMLITMVPRSGANFHWVLLKTVLGSPMSFFSTTDTGVTLNRFSQDLQLIDMDLPLAALNTFSTLVLCLAQIILIGIASIYAPIAFPVVLIALYYVQKYYLRTSRQLRFLDIEAKAPLYSQFLESLSGLVTIRAFGWTKQLNAKSLQLLDQSQRPFYQLFMIQRWLTLVLDLIVASIAVLLIVLVVTLRGKLNAGFVGVAMLNVILFSQSIKLLLKFWTDLETHIGSIARIKSFTESAATENLEGEDHVPSPDWPAEGVIEFKNISAAYKPGELVLDNISISIAAGQKIGICGRTGSGKSSLLLTLFRMLDLTSGTIAIDHQNISLLPRQLLRTSLNGLPQDPYFLSSSVRTNADPRSEVADSVIITALKSVELWDIVKGKGGLDVMIEELHLTHGQKQLFCLARAIVRKSACRILVLDEASSCVDAKTDTLIQSLIREHFSTHTIISVAHKLDTILDFDQVFVMDNGKIVEQGVPYDLLANKASIFSGLYWSSEARDNEEEEERVQ